jgi:hypothetical protein
MARKLEFGAVKVAVPKQFVAWSYSRYGDYTICPLKAKLKHLDKVVEPANAAMSRGGDIHKLAEVYVRDGGRLPPELLKFAAEFKRLRRLKGVAVELQLALDVQWAPTTWFGATTWLRAVVDCLRVSRRQATIIDYKTGKVRPENATQLGLYAIVAFAHHPELERVDAALWYLDHGEPISRAYVPGDIPALKAAWAKMVTPMLTDVVFKPTANRLCSWCWYGQAKKSEGGPGLCKF